MNLHLGFLWLYQKSFGGDTFVILALFSSRVFSYVFYEQINDDDDDD